MTTLESLQKEIDMLKHRNKTVEIDKARETSNIRKGLILLFTYLALAVYMRAIEIESPRLNAVVPSVGFWLSTLSLPRWKKLRLKYIKNI